MNSSYSFKAIAGGVASLPQEVWDRLEASRSPHLSHAFLASLETEDCLGDRVGWFPMPWVVENAKGKVVGVIPLYEKDNSFGEFVFDWAWVEAYQRHGVPYYPKWVVASPFTPASAPKFLTGQNEDDPALHDALLDAILLAAREREISSVHFLFTNEAVLAQRGLIHRLGCQFHWKNRGYTDFSHFLEALTSKRRKEILRERRKVRELGLVLRRRTGADLTSSDWHVFHGLYASTFARHGNYAALSPRFFERLGALLGTQILLVEALRGQDVIAAAFFLEGSDSLYGRYWGATESVPDLHFELCYYQGIEHAIEKGFSSFEPGAQGEHKISRGFLPEKTHSYHWIEHLGFREAIERHVVHENRKMIEYMTACANHSPYRESAC